jgi:hypothetical protein
MSDATENQPLNTCGCCKTGEDEPAHENRPGLSTLNYRLGTHGTILRRMLTRLSRQEIPDGDHAGQRPLAALTTRSPSDPAIALLDAWATTADVLTFYQERLANEGYLRTATERRSVLDLARAIGYELNPGVAAGTYLAFTVDDSPGTPDRVIIKAGTQVQSIPAKEGELPQTFETSEEFEVRVEWNTLVPQQTEHHPIAVGVTSLYLEGVNLRLAPGDNILIVGPERQGDSEKENWDIRPLHTVTEFPEDRFTKVTWKEGLGLRFGRRVIVSPAADPTARVYVFRKRLALFGHNAPDWRVMAKEVRESYCEGKPSSCVSAHEWPDFGLDTKDPHLHIDGDHPEITALSWLALTDEDYTELYLVKEAVPTSQTGFALTGKTTRVTLDTTESLNEFGRRSAVVLANPERLLRSEKPWGEPVTDNIIELDRLVQGLKKDQPLIVSGKLTEDDKELTREVVLVGSTVTSGNRTIVVLQEPLKHSYLRSTVTIYANVVPATHGETVAGEVLGSGDGAQAHQRFRLKRSPLTYVSAETITGNESTLKVRVNGVLWEQAPSLYAQPPAAEKYIVRIDDNAEATVIFGDGQSGARLPTGQENVQATYRFGIGSGGEVGAGALSLLKKRPFGVRSVFNPVSAGGAADPEKLENARTNAPLTVLTLDRIVSLQDFEDFARAFAGIGKAQAVNLGGGETPLVHLTVAEDNGDPVPEDLRQKLGRAIDRARDSSAEVTIDNYDLLTFDVEASVQFDSKYLALDVQAQIENALVATFSFEPRAFGQPVTAAELLSVIHQVPGVIAVLLDAPAVLPALTARRENGEILPAQLLLINETGIHLIMKPI